MRDVTIRAAADSDLGDVLDLYRHLNPRDPRPDPERAAAAWRALLAGGATTVFVADAARPAVATCVLSVTPNLTRGARPFAVIENVVTHPDHRGTGIGRLLLNAALDAAWQAGCYKAMLASGRDEGTLRFYEKCGFARSGKAFFEVRRD